METSVVAAALTLLLPIVILVCTVVGLILEYFLSKKTGMWPGLILPALTLTLSLVVLVLYYASMSSGMYFSATVRSDFASPESARLLMVFNTHLLMPFIILAVFNISTFILLVMYTSQRNKLRERQIMEKMNASILEAQAQERASMEGIPVPVRAAQAEGEKTIRDRFCFIEGWRSAPREVRRNRCRRPLGQRCGGLDGGGGVGVGSGVGFGS